MAKKKKKSASEASREVVWGGERVAEPEGIMSLMPPIRLLAINLSLNVNTSSSHQGCQRELVMPLL